jgi:hypothetical protein
MDMAEQKEDITKKNFNAQTNETTEQVTEDTMIKAQQEPGRDHDAVDHKQKEKEAADSKEIATLQEVRSATAQDMDSGRTREEGCRTALRRGNFDARAPSIATLDHTERSILKNRHEERGQSIGQLAGDEAHDKEVDTGRDKKQDASNRGSRLVHGAEISRSEGGIGRGEAEVGQVQPIGQMTADGCHAKEADRRRREGQDAPNRGSRIDRGAEISSSEGWIGKVERTAQRWDKCSPSGR